MKRALSNQVREGGKRYSLTEMLIDIVGRNSLLPRGESTLLWGLAAKFATMQTQKLIRDDNPERVKIALIA
jgi:hypothetical protein